MVYLPNIKSQKFYNRQELTRVRLQTPRIDVFAASDFSWCLDLRILHHSPRNLRIHIHSEARSTLSPIERGVFAPDNDGS